MRFVPKLFEKSQSSLFAGDNAVSGRVTVEPDWKLNTTLPIYGNSIRGPYRWFQDANNSQIEYEIPNIQSISWDRSSNTDIASCTITLYNTWHEGNEESPELTSHAGKSGYFWPKRGEAKEGEENPWNQTAGRGAYLKNGAWDAGFSWANVLVPNALIRTYQGYDRGQREADGTFRSIDKALEEECLLITGVWIVDAVTASSNGMMEISCKDIGRILLDQIVFPPTIPSALYPLEYFPGGFTRFDSFWGPKSKEGLPVGSRGEIILRYHDSSLDQQMSATNYSIDGHRPSHVIDGDWNTYGLSYGHTTPTEGDPEWFEFKFFQKLTHLAMKAWAGGYICYVSVNIKGDWQGEEENVVPGSGIPYVKRIGIPHAIPDGREKEIHIDLRNEFDSDGFPVFFDPEDTDPGILRITLENNYYSGHDTPGGMYRSGIRNLQAYFENEKATPYTSDYGALPWTFAMTSHPTNGYWVVDSGGTVHGFGEAHNYDTSSGHFPIPMGTNVFLPDQSYWAVGIAAHPTGKGYWVLDQSGTVHARGASAPQYDQPIANHGYYHNRVDSGSIHFSDDPRIPAVCIGVDIAATHTGEGYWVLYADGLILGFGDAEPKHVQLPETATQTFMANFLHGKDGMTRTRYHASHTGAAIASHPSKMGFWATNSGGEVFAYGECQHYGELINRQYNKDMADNFKLTSRERATSMESTQTGEGYWISFGSGKVAGFGDAKDKGPIDIYPGNPMADIPADDKNIDFQTIFRSLVWSIARDPDGSGFWILLADGSVRGYDAEFWGQPSYFGQSGIAWHEGNFDGDWSAIVKEILLWSGFTLYDPEIGEDESPAVFGAIESTGIQTDTFVSAEKFDKKNIMDVIKELAEVVAYDFRITEDGSVEFSSPNIWRAGNFDTLGERIYVTYDESGPTRVTEDTEGAEPFLPLISEAVNMFDYSATLSFDAMRSEVIIGTDAPSTFDPSSTGYVRKIPRDLEKLRGIPRPAMWISQIFENEEELNTMAELIALRMWFAERSSSITCIANPCISVGDQIRLHERNTNETFIHYVSSISSEMDLDAGTWDYKLSTNWLGDADNWVITTQDPGGPYDYFVISERIDRWQEMTQRGLPTGGAGHGSLEGIVDFNGKFTTSITVYPWSYPILPDVQVDPEAEPPDPEIEFPEQVSGGTGEWAVEGTLTINTRVQNAFIRTDILSVPIRKDARIVFLDDDNNVMIHKALPMPGQALNLPDIGFPGMKNEIKFLITGRATKVGNGEIKLTFGGLNVKGDSFQSTILVVNG